MTNLSENNDYHRGLLKQYQKTTENGNQTSLVSSTSAGDKDPNGTLLDTRNGAIENAEENVELSSRHSATHGSRKQPSIAKSTDRRKGVRKPKLRKKQLRERPLELEQEREEIELRRQQEELRLQQQQLQQQQEEELRLKMQQQDELSL